MVITTMSIPLPMLSSVHSPPHPQPHHQRTPIPASSPAIMEPEGPWAPAEPPSNMLLQEWKYEMRREAQVIVPNLYLGPFQASTNMRALKEKGITHILCLRDTLEARLIFPRFPTEFRYLTMDVSDSDAQNIISIFPRCREFIDEALSCGGAVLVHCNSGIATAPAIVMGYLMRKFGWEYTTALAYVQSKRYCVSPASFENQLREYAAIAQAHKAIKPAGVTGGIVGEHKRPWDGDSEESTPRGTRRRLSDSEDADGDVQMAM